MNTKEYLMILNKQQRQQQNFKQGFTKLRRTFWATTPKDDNKATRIYYI
jgi:hypothetical protein